MARRMQTVAVATQKGGAGKTTTTHNLAAAIYLITAVKPLVLDLDPQGNLTTSCGFDKNEDGLKTILDFFQGEPLENVALDVERFDLIPSNAFTADLEIKLVTATARETVLRRLLKKVEELDRYEYVLMDCPGNLGLITINALVAAKRLLVPVQCEFHALSGITELEETLSELREAFDIGFDTLEAIPVMYDKKLTLSRDVRNALRRLYPATTYETPVQRRVALAEAPSAGHDIFDYDTVARSGQSRDDYRNVAIEFLRRGA